MIDLLFLADKADGSLGVIPKETGKPFGGKRKGKTCRHAEDPRLILLGDRGPSRPAEVSDRIIEPRRGEDPYLVILRLGPLPCADSASSLGGCSGS